MPDIYGPTGEKHSFPDGTPLSQIQALMASKYGGPTATQGADAVTEAPKETALTSPGQMPVGTMQSRIQVQSHAPDVSAVPLSQDAERAMKMLRMRALDSGRGGVSAANDLLKADPTYQAREKMFHKMGEDAGTLAAKQAAGTRVYSAINELEQKSKAWLDHAPSAFNAATGEYYSNPWVQLSTGWANQGGQAFHRLLSHDIAKLTALYREMPSSGKGSGSDAQDANFKEAMGEFAKAKTPEQYFAIMQSAKQLIRDKSGLPHDFDLPRTPLHPTDVAAVNQYASKPISKDSHYVTGAALSPEASAAQLSSDAIKITPPQGAIDDLLKNANNPVYTHYFNKNFNGGQPGLAEQIIVNAGRGQPEPVQQQETPSPIRGDPNAPHNLLRRLFGQDPT